MTEYLKGTASPTVNLTRTRTDPGIPRYVRKLKHWEMFVGLTDDLINMCEKPSDQVQAWFRDVFSEEQRRELNLRLHPLYKRWTLFQKIRKENGEYVWGVVCSVYEDPKPGLLPVDLQRKDHLLDHLTGYMGENRPFEKVDFEFIEKMDTKKYGVKGVCEFIERLEKDKEVSYDKQWDDFIDDFLDYNFWSAMRDAQETYSKPWSVGTVELKSDPSRWKVEKKNGYTVKTRIHGDEGDMNEMAHQEKIMKDAYENNSQSAKAALHILSIKNEKFFQKHGETLWERVTGKKVVWSDFKSKLEEDNEKERQAKELLDISLSKKVEEGVTIEEWLSLTTSQQQQQSSSSKPESEEQSETLTQILQINDLVMRK